MASTEENIHVIIRFRPTNKREKKEQRQKKIQDKPPIFQNDAAREIGVVEICGTKSDTPHNFTFDRILDAKASQQEVFTHVAQPVCDDVLIGYNGCIFAYGQTGSGKTYTMFGPEGDSDDPQAMGIIPRSVAHIFSGIEEDPNIIDARIKVSFLEIYKEQLRDLLNPSRKKKSKKKKIKKPLLIREMQNGETRVLNLKEKNVKTLLDVLSLIEVANSYRTKAETSMNHSSSRSHMLMTLTVTLRMEDGSMHVGKLNFCDLAGSERIHKTNATGDRLKEAMKINLSLTILGQVISALSQEKKHVPFRDSQLTNVLKDSLGGNCKTTLIVNGTKHMFNREETISSLRFGSRCKLITNEVKINRTYSNKELMKMIEKLRRQNAKLKADLQRNKEEDIITSPMGNKLFDRKKKKKPKQQKVQVDDWGATSTKANDDWGSTGGSIGVNKKWEQEKKKLKKKITKLEDKYHHIGLENNKLEEKLTALEEQLYDKQRQSTLYQTQTADNDRLATENQELKLNIKSLESLNDEYRMEIGDMRKERHFKATKLNDELDKFKQLQVQSKSESSGLVEEVLKFKQSAEKSEALIDALDHQLAERRKDMDSLQRELVDKERRVSSVFKEKTALQTELNDMKVVLTNNELDLSQKDDKIEQLKDELDRRTQELTAEIHELTETLEQREMIQHSVTIRNMEPETDELTEDVEDNKEDDFGARDVLIQAATIHNIDEVIHAEKTLLAQCDYLEKMETMRRETSLMEMSGADAGDSKEKKKEMNVPSDPKEQKKALEQEVVEKKKKLKELREMKRPDDKGERLKLFLKIGSLEDDVSQLKRKIKRIAKQISKEKKSKLGVDKPDIPSKVTTNDVMHYIDAALTLSEFRDEDSD
eukprot:39233_1